MRDRNSDQVNACAPQVPPSDGYLHIHFGAGRLGLGLVAPFFRTSTSELYLLNRAVSGSKATGTTSITPERRNHLLEHNPNRCYLVKRPDGEASSDGEVVTYNGFYSYDDASIGKVIRSIAASSSTKAAGVVVSASILNIAAYANVVRALNALSAMAAEEEGAIGPIFLVACENTFSADAVLADPGLAPLISAETRARVISVRAMVDRICTALDEVHSPDHPTVRVGAEDYGSLILELSPATDALEKPCRRARVEFSRHVDAEKQIKGWLLNGGHGLIALNAFQVSHGDRTLKLNQYLEASSEHRAFAAAVMEELCEGIAIVLRSDPVYAAFVRETDIDAYLQTRAQQMLRRFIQTEDPVSRILARFQAPANGVDPVAAFAKRFAGRINLPMEAYEAEKGAPPPASSRAVFSLYALIASGKFVDAELDLASPLLPQAEAALALDTEAVPGGLDVQTYVLNDNSPERVNSKPAGLERSGATR